MKKEDFVSLGVSEDAAEKAAEAFAEALGGFRLEGAVEAAVARSGARNVKAVKALLDLSGAVFSEDGTVAGLKEQLDALKSAGDTEFLFVKPGAAGEAFTLSGAVTGEADREIICGGTDFSKLNYSELCAFLEKHPKTDL
ncbi:MAG: phage scaffolding protein [Oscillospiraceae bacterium]|jgi:hypothetical protein|nr:phage scaffolding protein [Oscillospiraceae bacterium]